MMMPRVEVKLPIYLSPWDIVDPEKDLSPTKHCRITSALVEKALQAVGQSGAALNNMSVLQAYQADLLDDVSIDVVLDETAFSELCCATNVSLRATGVLILRLVCTGPWGFAPLAPLRLQSICILNYIG